MSTTSLPSVQRPEFPVRQFTVDEYHRLGEVGILTEDDRVELLEGFVVPKMIHNPPHDATVKLTDEAIRNRLTAEWHTRVQSGITTVDSEPEPDVAVVRGSIRDFAARHPGPRDIGMLAEVAESSLERDRSKRRLYSRAGIPYYWIINLAGRQVEVYSEATGQEQAADYREKQIYRVGQTVPLVLDGQHLGNIPVSDLLP